ncbi:hypothetical protein PANT_12c00069 [Moesziomyces antarcticus T-34]|uniref:Uncharacterized protein n=1 Tax=Pseudozyma antarctica (strain T-34) TaxID=1151754 RepID=M9LQC8_PSEA3|nr:hypothetical protein PANT_12c00069 [Moesziomyces antarcticus T-34]
MSDRAVEYKNILPFQASEGKLEARHASAVPSASVFQGLDASDQDDALASQHAQHVQPLSPLTLGELGLQPPETPSALIDITPSKTAIVHSSTSRNNRSATNRTHPKVYSTAQLAGPGGPDADSSFNGRAQTGNASHFTSGMASTDASANASSESIEDPLLAKFLQSLVDDGSTLTEPTSTTESYSNAESSPPSLLPTSTAPRPASTLDRFPSMQLTPPMRRAALQRTALANTGSAPNRYGLLPVQNARCMAPFLSAGVAAEHVPSATTCGDTTSQSSSYPVASSGHLSTMSEYHLSLKPSERCHASPKKGKRIVSSGLEDTVRDLSGKEQQPGVASKPPWSLDLASLSQLALPQAPPLQPLHRYPSQILESDGRYDSDRDMDRDSEAGYQLGTSPSRVDGSRASSKAANADIPATQPFSSDVAIGPGDSGSRSSVTRALSLQKNADGSRTTESVSACANADNPADRLHSVPDPMRVTSGSISSRAACEGSSGKAGLSARTSSASKSNPTTTTVPDPSGKASQHSPTCQDRSASGTSSNFTRKVLFDFIRRTNLQRPVIPSSAGTIRSSSDSFAGSADTSPVEPLSKKSSRPLSSSWPSTVPAELQAHLQNWQQQRKRSKPSSASQDEAATSSPSGHTRRAQAGKISPPSQKERKEAPSNARRAINSEQEKKTQRQEQYQRLLQRLQAQMRSSMQRERDKKKQNIQEMGLGGGEEKRELRDDQERDWKQDPSAKMDPHGRPDMAGQHQHGAVGSKTKPTSSKRSWDDAGLSSRSNQKNNRQSEDTKDEAPTPANQLQEVVLNQVAGPAGHSTLVIGPSDIPTQARKIPRAAEWAEPERTLSPKKPAVTSRAIESPFPLPSSSYTQYQQSTPHPTWGQQSSLPLGSFECSHAWISSPFGAAAYPGTPPMLGPPGFVNSALTGSLGYSPSLELMQSLALKHPNWRQDFPDSLAPAVFARESFPTMPALSKGALETGLSSVLASCIDPREISCLTATETTTEPSPAGAKRPFSPGDRVVFWAVKGTASVKLKGVVESMTADSADITVEMDGDESLREQNGHGGGVGTQAVSHQEEPITTCQVYRNISWANIVPRQQAIALRFLRADE